MANPESKITTIKLTKDTKKRLDKLKIHKRESYEDVLQKMFSIFNVLRQDPLQARSKLNEIDTVKKTLSNSKKAS